MAITTFAELKTAIANWLERDDLTNRIPEFVSLAEDRIGLETDIRIRAMETSSDLTVDAQTVALPTRYLESRRIYLDGTPRRRLDFLTPENFWIRNLSTQTSQPQFFTVEGEDLVFGPAPDSTYTGKHLFYQKFASLSADTDTNWILTNARGLLLYGSLLEAEPFIKNDPRLTLWASLYDDLVEKVKKSDKRDRYSGAPLMARSDVQIDVGTGRTL